MGWVKELVFRFSKVVDGAIDFFKLLTSSKLIFLLIRK